MVTMFDDSLLNTIGNLKMFLEGTLPITFQPLRREERSRWIRSTLVRFKYITLKRAGKQIVHRYVMKVADLSRAQVARHIAAYRDNASICASYKRRSFPTLYTAGDVELLAATDNLHGRLNGAATIALMGAEFIRGDRRYERLKNISVSRLYDLRGKRQYVEHALTIEKTKPTQVPIGERRKPDPNGTPGFLRVDTVHQGDFGKEKGVYHINHVDEVTQWEVIVAVEQISEARMEPALEEAFSLFPFPIRNFHSDNGGEYINDVVQQFLVRWKSKQTKGRPRHSNDNGLAETKNGAIIRKHMTYHHIPQPFAARINQFYREHLIPYLNFHRPCAFPKVEVLRNGKKKVTYPPENYLTPYEKLKSQPNWQQHLCPGITPAMLEAQANAKTPNQAAREMQEAKKKLFDVILPRYRGIL
jgi:transposase InsO family protein